MNALADPYAQGINLYAMGRYAEAIEQFERVLAVRPDDARTLFALGNTARALGMSGPAEEFFRRVLILEPLRLEAVVSLANLLRAQGQFERAETILKSALMDQPDAPELWLTLGSTYREMGDAGRAAAHYREALERRPGYAAALGNLADLLGDDGDHGAALALYNRALKAEPGNSQARMNRAILNLLAGNLKEGWRDYAARLMLRGKVPVPDHGLRPWDGGSLKRTKLLVTAEQGVGDQIMFASMIPELAARAQAEGGRLVLECEPRLLTLFARSFPTVEVRKWDIETRAGVARTHYGWLKADGGANAAIEMGTLPHILRKTIGNFPEPNIYLRAAVEETLLWQSAFADVPRPIIGLCWRSGSTGGHRALQYAPLQDWAAFIRTLPGTAVCMQYDATDREISTLEAMSGRTIMVPKQIDQKNELDRVAAMSLVLDAVVSAPTAVAWLSAAVGVKTYKVLYDSSWTSFGSSFEPFAPCASCMMPSRRGDWAEVFAKTARELTSRFVA